MKRIIASLERFLRTDIRYFFHGSFWLTVGRGSGALTAFFLSILYARYLPKELYGDYRYILSVLGMFGIFALPGVATVITRGVARGFEGTFLRGSRLIFFSSFIITVLGVSTGVWFFLHGKPSLGGGFVIAALLTPFAEGLGNWRAYFDGLRLFRAKTFWNVSATILQGICMASAVAAIVFFSLSLAQSIFILVGIFYLGNALPNIVWHVRTRRLIRTDAPSEPGALRYGIHLSLLDMPSTFSYYLDSVLLHTFLGPSALAVYSFAIAPPEQIKGLLGATATVAFPKIAARTESHASLKELRATLPKKILRATVFTVLIVGLYIICAPFLFNVFFPRYSEAVPFSQVFAASLLLFPFGFFHTAIQTEGNLKKVYRYQIIWPLMQIGAMIALIPLFGIWGAVAGKLIGRFANHLLSLFFFMRD